MIAGLGRAGVALAAVTVAMVTLAGCGESSDATSADDSSSNVESPTSTATVIREDLVETVTLQGTLGYGDTIPMATNSTGVVTSLPEVGDVINPGEAIFEVNGKPVILLLGETAAWRPFFSTMTDGDDVEQLEQNLVALGYVSEDNLTIDRNMTATTANGLEEMWDDVLNRARQANDGDDDEDNGDDEFEPENFNIRRANLGEIVFAPGPVRIAQLQVSLGLSINPSVVPFLVTGARQLVSVAVRPSDRDLFEVGTEASIELPDGEIVEGTVTDVDDVATRIVEAGGQTSAPTIAVEIEMDSVPEGAFDAAPVEVEVVETVTADVLTVPAAALVALAEGGNAVELVTDSGTQLVAVEIGRFADARVEVTGELQEGDEVVVPGL